MSNSERRKTHSVSVTLTIPKCTAIRIRYGIVANKQLKLKQDLRLNNETIIR